jgi:AbrB family looped-hinge helix DNA binding protein
MKATAKLTSKGQITIPAEIRKRFGMRTGDRLTFINKNDELRVVRDEAESPFAKWQGFDRHAKASSVEDIVRQTRELRGHDDLD